MPSDSSPALSSWAQARLSAIYEAQEDDAFHTAFDAAFSPSCQITLNHTSISREEFKNQLSGRRGFSIGAVTRWDNDNVIFVPPDDKSVSEQAGIVAASLVVERSMKFRIRVGPAQRHTYICLSVKIEPDPSITDSDNRRIVSYIHTAVDKAPPIHFHTTHGGKAAKQD